MDELPDVLKSLKFYPPVTDINGKPNNRIIDWPKKTKQKKFLTDGQFIIVHRN